MQDELMEWVPADTENVAVSDPWDLDYWTRYFRVNGSRLRRAIAAVGNRRADILANLSRTGAWSSDLQTFMFRPAGDGVERKPLDDSRGFRSHDKGLAQPASL